jgi:hypothetical protein
VPLWWLEPRPEGVKMVDHWPNKDLKLNSAYVAPQWVTQCGQLYC